MQIHAIYGPTGCGKTSLAIKLAVKYQAPLISIDSRKIYRELDILTHKQPLQDYFIRHPEQKYFGLDLYNPTKSVNVSDFQLQVYSWLNRYYSTLPEHLVIWGGSGLYLDSVLWGLPHYQNNVDLSWRRQLASSSLKEIQVMLERENPSSLAGLSRSELCNKRRLIRRLEVAKQSNSINLESKDHATKMPKDKKIDGVDNVQKSIPPIYEKVCRQLSESDLLIYLPCQVVDATFKQSLHNRVSKMFKAGAIDETEKLLAKYGHSVPALQVMGYRQIVAWLLQKPSFSTITKNVDSLVDKVAMVHYKYAKKQFTWQRRYYRSVNDIYPQRGVHMTGIYRVVSSMLPWVSQVT